MPKDNKKHSYSLRSRKKHTKVEKKKSKEELKKTCYVESSSDSDDSIWSEGDEIDEEFRTRGATYFMRLHLRFSTKNIIILVLERDVLVDEKAKAALYHVD